MKSLTLAIGAGVAIASEPSLTNRWTTDELIFSTNEFLKSYKEKIKPFSHRKMQTIIYSTRAQRLGGKSNKSSKSGSIEDNIQVNNEMFRLLPSACPGHCVSSKTNGNNEMVDSLSQCHGSLDYTQWWIVHSDKSYVVIESYAEVGFCISVDFESGDSEEMLANACKNGVVTLKDCHEEFGTEWYFTGGQLVSSLCWSAGISSLLTVYPVENKPGECDGSVSVFGASNDSILRADTFMFVDRLPKAPFDVNDYVTAMDEVPTLMPTGSRGDGQSSSDFPTLEPTLSPETR